MTRGLLKPDPPIKDQKDQEAYKIFNESCFLKADQLDGEHVKVLNGIMQEMDKQEVVELEAETVNYKKCLLAIYKDIEDPFGTELIGDEFNYE